MHLQPSNQQGEFPMELIGQQNVKIELFLASGHRFVTLPQEVVIKKNF